MSVIFTLRLPGSLAAKASAKSVMAWFRYRTVECCNRFVCSTMASTTSGWQCPQHTVAIPPNASRYLLPLSSNRYCLFPSTTFSCIPHNTISNYFFIVLYSLNGLKIIINTNKYIT